ncbi:hypothetical protein J3R30DRAFT_3295146, partial [Lentinula aciculospora]
NYAHKNNILFLCYPLHGTCVYQGLDVVVFSVFKLCICQQHGDHCQKTGESYQSKFSPDLQKCEPLCPDTQNNPVCILKDRCMAI